MGASYADSVRTTVSHEDFSQTSSSAIDTWNGESDVKI